MITEACGYHCGTVNSDERHCPCPECHKHPVPELGPLNQDPVAARLGLIPLAGTPMCASWYRDVQVMPWTARLDGCMCGVSAQKPYEQHGTHCPVRLHWARRQPGQDPAEAPGIIGSHGLVI